MKKSPRGSKQKDSGYGAGLLVGLVLGPVEDQATVRKIEKILKGIAFYAEHCRIWYGDRADEYVQMVLPSTLQDINEMVSELRALGEEGGMNKKQDREQALRLLKLLQATLKTCGKHFELPS